MKTGALFVPLKSLLPAPEEKKRVVQGSCSTQSPTRSELRLGRNLAPWNNRRQHSRSRCSNLMQDKQGRLRLKTRRAHPLPAAKKRTTRVKLVQVVYIMYSTMSVSRSAKIVLQGRRSGKSPPGSSAHRHRFRKPIVGMRSSCKTTHVASAANTRQEKGNSFSLTIIKSPQGGGVEEMPLYHIDNIIIIDNCIINLVCLLY